MLSILDCTLRDGGYINNWRYNTDFVNNINDVCNELVNYVEIGFINKTNNYKNQIVGKYRTLDLDEINSFSKYNFKTVVMADFADINIDILKEKPNIDLIRIAFHKKDLNEALKMCKTIKDYGYKVSVNAMAITNYEVSELEYLIDYINEHNLDILYVADSYGSLHQDDIKYYFHLLDSQLNERCSMGFHLHNNMNNAYGNYEYLKMISSTSVTRNIIVDTTMFGMGRGAGNLQSELVIINENKDIELNRVIKLLNFIQDYIKPIYKTNENSWGYELDYLLSGYVKMHPNYIVKMRDLDISMKNRFFLIEKMTQQNIKYNIFDIDTLYKLIGMFKDKLI